VPIPVRVPGIMSGRMTADPTPPPLIVEPREGTIYEGPEGPMLFVRHEDGEALFVLTKDRVVFTRRYPADRPDLWPEMKLVHDPKARDGIRELLGDANELQLVNHALSVAMKRAVALLPVEAANDLRQTAREAMPGGKFPTRRRAR
jgi:hypothetical protein